MKHIILPGDCQQVLSRLPANFIHCCVTSPPYYGLRDYGVSGQVGLEQSPEEYLEKMVAIFGEVRRVLRDDGTCWLNLGDSYGWSPKKGGSGTPNGRNLAKMGYTGAKPISVSLKEKDLIGIPWRVAFALQADGWYLRQDIIWHKTNPMPESVRDRCTKSHEYIFLLAKSKKYWYDHEAIKEPAAYPPGTRKNVKKGGFNSKYAGDVTRKGDESFRANRSKRNKRDVWTISTKPYKGAHFAVFPPDLIRPCILAGCPPRACAACGKGYKRVLNEKRDRSRPRAREEHAAHANATPQGGYRGTLTTTTLGWEPQCDCDAGVTEGVVLDPFGGSGTTALTAKEEGRSSLLVELNPEYIKLANKRLV